MGQHTVLVVDDEAASLRALQRTLAADYRVLTAGNGREALALLAVESVALIIADQRMPQMLGSELLARSAELHPEAIRILLTGYTDLDTVIGAINAGRVYYYLTKPWEPPELRLVVRRGLERHEAETERRRLVRQLEDTCARLRRETDQKSRLLTMAAHELGTPLHVVLNALDVLGAMALPAEAMAWLNTASRNCQWLGRGLGAMAVASRAQAGSIRLRPVPTCLGRLWSALHEELRTRMSGRELSIIVDIDEHLPRIEADEQWLRLAMASIVSNAVRFTPDGGTVTVRARADVGANRMALEVCDTGTGIEAGLLDEIFEPFSAAGGDPFLHQSGSLEFGARGLGLGLSVASAIVRLHGGSILAESRLQMGSCFTILLPLRSRDMIT